MSLQFDQNLSITRPLRIMIWEHFSTLYLPFFSQLLVEIQIGTRTPKSEFRKLLFHGQPVVHENILFIPVPASTRCTERT
jgi:hypothetical protein